MIRRELEGFDDIWLIQLTPPAEPYLQGNPSRLRLVGLKSGIRKELPTGRRPSWTPPWNKRSLCIVFHGSSTFGHFLEWGWSLPANVLDLHAEYRLAVAGRDPDPGYDWADACREFELHPDCPRAMESLLKRLAPTAELQPALVRGRYTGAVARMEATGIPIDVDFLNRLTASWSDLKWRLVAREDASYRLFRNGRLDPELWGAWLDRRGLKRPLTSRGRLKTDLETLADMAKVCPDVQLVMQIQATLARFRPFELVVGADGRCRCPLRQFASKTGRNQPGGRFLFNRAVWARGLIRPGPGMALAYLDFEQQEFGIAAGLSNDPAMREAYESGDAYLAFALQAGAVPAGATKESHPKEREAYKTCALGVQYGMGKRTLAQRLGLSEEDAKKLITQHRRTYRRFWQWADKYWRQAKTTGWARTRHGWGRHVTNSKGWRGVRNFPVQASAADLLRAVCIGLTENGVKVCAPVHDAILVEDTTNNIERTAEKCRKVMEAASTQVAGGIRIRVGVNITRWPDRFSDERGTELWETINQLLEGEAR